jgi:cobalamin biosynthesis protein CobD/CbiB
MGIIIVIIIIIIVLSVVISMIQAELCSIASSLTLVTYFISRVFLHVLLAVRSLTDNISGVLLSLFRDDPVL